MSEEQLEEQITMIFNQVMDSMHANPMAWVQMLAALLGVMGVTVALWFWARHKFNNP